MKNALIEMLRNGGCYWPRPPNDPARSLAVPNGAQFRIALAAAKLDAPRDERPSGGTPSRVGRKPEAATAPPSITLVGGVCRNGAFIIVDGVYAGRFETLAAAAEMIGAPVDDLFARVEFLVGAEWMSADALRRSDALPWGEVDEVALAIAAETIRDKAKEIGETIGEAAVIRKAAEAVATFSHFHREARQRLAWMS